MSNLFLSGSAEYNSNLELFLKDQLSAMGTAMSQDEGSLVWCEAFAIAKAFAAGLNFIQLMGNQLSPINLSIFGNRFANIYGIAAQGNGIVPTNISQIKTYVGLKEAEFGTPPTYSAVYQFISTV